MKVQSRPGGGGAEQILEPRSVWFCVLSSMLQLCVENWQMLLLIKVVKLNTNGGGNSVINPDTNV